MQHGIVVGELHVARLQHHVQAQVFAVGDRIENILADREFDLVVFEYWHAFRCAGSFRRRGIPTVLDMHNVLWRGQERNLRAARLPEWWVQWAVARYRKAEEQAWERFDGLIAINRSELDYVAKKVSPRQRLFYAPMGAYQVLEGKSTVSVLYRNEGVVSEGTKL